MLSVAKIAFEIRRRNDPEQQAAKPAATDLPAPCGGCAREADCVQGGTTKGTGHDDLETPADYRPRRKPLLPGAAAPRHRRFSTQHRASVRRPLEIDPRA